METCRNNTVRPLNFAQILPQWLTPGRIPFTDPRLPENAFPCIGLGEKNCKFLPIKLPFLSTRVHTTPKKSLYIYFLQNCSPKMT